MAELDNDRLGEMLTSAMSDPRFGQILSTLKEKSDSGEIDASDIGGVLSALSGGGMNPSGHRSASEDEHAPTSPEGENKRGGLSPDALSKIPDLMKIMGPLMGGGEKGKTASNHGDMEKHRRLLTALKPYLAEDKRGAVESILKISEVTDIFDGLLGGK